MTEKNKHTRLRRPVYKTVFSVTEELYDSPDAATPVFSRTLRGRFRIDLLRTLCIGTIVLSCAAVAGLLAGDR
ncbi:MAG: hypothetical protein IJY20_02415 [Clostridia bacterium]|nr:hypothetical protein [Clostridia bacterium]